MVRINWVGLVLSVVIVSGAIAQAAEANRNSAVPAHWPQWRGPTRDGQIEAVAWPERISGEALKLIWRKPLGPSYSGPIVSETLVFTTETRDKTREIVHAFDRVTGEQRWEAAWDGSVSVPFFAKSNGDWIRSTPALDDDRLYVTGMRDVLICLNANTGQTVWQVDFLKELKTPLPAFGCVCSPLVDGDALFVQAGAGVCKVDKRTGKIIWRVMEDGGGMWGSAFSSPIIRTVAGKRQLLVQTREKLAGLDVDSGRVLWSETIPSFRGMNILTPTVYGSAVFTSSYGGKTMLFQLKSEGEAVSASEAWTNKATGYMSSPVVIDGHAYLHLRNQRFTCIDLATGATRWTTTPFGKYWSLVANRDRILALDERGELLLIRATPEKYDELDSRKISDDETWAHLAVCGDQLVVRELNALAVYRWSSQL